MPRLICEENGTPLGTIDLAKYNLGKHLDREALLDAIEHLLSPEADEDDGADDRYQQFVDEECFL